MNINRSIFAALVIALAGCGGGGGNNDSTQIIDPPVVVEPPVIVEPPIIVEPPVIIEPEFPVFVEQMNEPDACPTDPNGTDGDYPFSTCDGIPTAADIDYPYTAGNREVAVVDLLAVVDTKLDFELEGLTPQEFAQKEIDFANKVYKDSGVDIMIRLVGIETVEVAVGDLYRQSRAFARGQYEFGELDTWMQESGADYAFLFKQIEEEPIACGVAYYTASREDYRYRRGVTQCFRNTVFQDTTTTRYYERAGETFTHEMGHLFGLDHNIESSMVETPVFQFSYGYLVPGYDPMLSDEWNGYGTIMSYSDKATGRMSDRDAYFVIPETGQSQALGRELGPFNLLGLPRDPATDAVDHLQRVRWYISQLHETYNTPEGGEESELEIFNAAPNHQHAPDDVCLF